MRYEWALVRFAWTATVDALKRRGSFVVDGVLWLVGAGVYWWWQGPERALEQVVGTVAFGLIPVGAFAIVVGFWNLAVAPYRLHRKLDHDHASLRSEIAGVKNKQQILAGLTYINSLGHALMNEAITSEAGLEVWKKKVKSWESRAILIGYAVSIQAASRIKSVAYDVRRFQKKFNDEHNDYLNALHRRLEIIDDLVRQYE